MTKQITIKLNEKIYKPILDELMQHGTSKSNSECVAKCIMVCKFFLDRKGWEKFGYTLPEMVIKINHMCRNSCTNGN